MGTSDAASRVLKQLSRNKFIFIFFVAHAFFSVLLGRIYVLAPDEVGYLFAFNNIYNLPITVTAQSGSGWIAAPTMFLWVAYLPAKVLSLIGLPDYLSIRLLSILLTTVSLYLLVEILRRSTIANKNFQKYLFAAFYIPSVFLWTSVGLRESFIIMETTFFLAGLNFVFRNKIKYGSIFLFLGSYGLVSTKNYLWAVLMITVILTGIILFCLRYERRKVIVLCITGFLLPLIAFTSTTSTYALNHLFSSNITETGERSGDSITQVYVETQDAGGKGVVENKATEELITFHGDSSLIALHFYLIDQPDSDISKILRFFHLDKRIQSLWDEKVKAGLIHKDKKVGTDTSSLNGHIIKPGNISQPLTIFWAAFVFLCGPFPFIGDPGIAISIAALESPLWWFFYALVIFQLIRFRKIKFMKDPQIIFISIFLTGEIALSALLEVNLGTAFRHRSILLIPLVFLCLRLEQMAKEQRDLRVANIQ
jgi:hypothetical protein